MGGFGGSGSTGKRYNVTLSLNARNAINHVNLGSNGRPDFAVLRAIDQYRSRRLWRRGRPGPVAAVAAAREVRAAGGGGSSVRKRRGRCRRLEVQLRFQF